MSQQQSSTQGHDAGYVLRICAVAALGGVLFGYDTAVISGAVDSIKQYFGLTAAQTGWAELMEQHYLDMQALAQTLLRAMTLALNIERDFFDSRFVDPVSVLRMIHYPPRHTASCAEQQGAGAHTDYGCITLLYQDSAGGLQVRNVRGEWIDAPPIDGTFVVNLGDMMARWSNDRYRSTPHRVISPLGVDRYSMPFFAEPHPDTRIECLPGCQDAQHPAKYPTTTCAEFLLSRFADTYAYRREQEAV